MISKVILTFTLTNLSLLVNAGGVGGVEGSGTGNWVTSSKSSLWVLSVKCGGGALHSKVTLRKRALWCYLQNVSVL